jgi:dipeptidyl aminopeptidase/acylaminoacyl peptidase
VEGKDRQLTDFNRAWIVGLDLRTHENFTFKSSGGHNVEGWIMKPSGYKKGKKYPMVVEIHGGPRAAYGNALMHEFQLLAGEGYAVMYINPYGSGGYTEDFQSGLPEHYGEQDYADIMEAVDYCIKTYDYVDAARLGVLGGSYGGFMTNWIVTHTDKFKAAVTMRSISNWVSFFGTSDIGWTFGLKEMGGIPWIDEEKYMVKSPIRYVKNVKTPTLILQSEEDYRCPMEQAEQFFTALKFLGVTTEFVRTPGENHELSRSGKPKHREARLEHIVRWFRTYL